MSNRPLTLELGSRMYVNDSISIDIIRCVFKARTEQINLNLNLGLQTKIEYIHNNRCCLTGLVDLNKLP